ncbi:hypothetical protein ACWEFJ_02490 [Actinosynnema sp. NPDC004786]
MARLDAVFCTSDDMALGVVGALRETASSNTEETIVIGVDGIPKTLNMIATGGSPLWVTIPPGLPPPRGKRCRNLQRMVDGRTTMKRAILKPRVFEAFEELRPRAAELDVGALPGCAEDLFSGLRSSGRTR